MPGLPDIVTPGLRVVFVGTSVGDVSSRREHYYSHHLNSFYRDLHASGLTDRLLSPDEDWELLRHGIGLTDVAKERVASDDRLLRAADFSPERLEQVIKTNRPLLVCFNGKAAYKAWRKDPPARYGMQAMTNIDGVPLFVVPSTGGRVSGDEEFDGRTRRQWFLALRQWLDQNRNDHTADGDIQEIEEAAVVDHVTEQPAACLVGEIVQTFKARGYALYGDGVKKLTFVRDTGRDLVVLRPNNPLEWRVPLDALSEAARKSLRVGRPLRARECNEICNRRGTPISVLLRVVPESRYSQTE